MNKIEELIEQLCPNGIEYRELQEVVNLTMGTSPAGNTFSSNSNNGIEFHQGKTSFGNEIIKHSNVYTTSPIKVAEPDSLIMSVRAPVGDTNLTNRKIAIGRGLCSMVGRDSLMTKFLYYFINDNVRTFKNKSNGSTFEAINTQEIKKILIPIPPLPIQQEIVNTLDSFSKLQAELQAELQARRAQYEYYCNELLSFDGKEVEWKMLGEVTSLITKGTTPKSYEQRGISFIKTESFDGSQINKSKLSFIDEITHQTFLKRSILKADDILFTIAGATIGKSAIVTDDILPANTNQALAIIRLTTKVNKKYIFYILKSQYMRKYITQSVKGSAQPNLNLQQLNDFQIPIPPLSEQNRIVEILDKFDKLVNDISVGLPAEIKARQKQYEYYRSKLLNFRIIND